MNEGRPRKTSPSESASSCCLIAFVFSFLPSVITPFDSSVGGAETAQADRIADLVVHNVSTETANNVSRDKFNDTYANAGGNLTETLGLRSATGTKSIG